VNIPQDAKPGRYTGIVTASAPGCKPVEQQAELEVIDAELPAPKDWKIHLDLWQHPQAVARWHDVELWSKTHFAIMRPLMKRLAEAGQKCITCTILDEAWNGQTYDWFPSMIRWVRGKDGVMRYLNRCGLRSCVISIATCRKRAGQKKRVLPSMNVPMKWYARLCG